MTRLHHCLVAVAAIACAHAMTLADPLPPFGADVKLPARQLKAAKPYALQLDCLSPAAAATWMTENPKAGTADNPFKIAKEDNHDVLVLSAKDFEPGRTTVRTLLPGDGPANGSIWSKNQANVITFWCKSDKPTDLTFHLLLRGKSAGTYQAGFSAKAGDWQQVVIPVGDFGLKSFANIAGVGVRVASPNADGVVRLRDIGVGAMTYSDDSWKSHRLSISINGDWHFAPDSANKGLAAGWNADAFDDSNWQVLKSGTSWQEQGADNRGYGWYRQKLTVPKEYAGTPLTLNLTSIPSDDDVWFNGQRIGGFNSEYKYSNWIDREYTVRPSLIRYGEPNTIALRIWGGDITFIGNKSGLIKGPLAAELDPYRVLFRAPGGEAVAAELFDLGDAQHGQPFEMVLPFPAELAKEAGATLHYRIADFGGNEVTSGNAPLAATDKSAQAVIPIDRDTSHTIYLRGRIRVELLINDASGTAIYSGKRELDHLTFFHRDNLQLPALADQADDTPYGKLKLIDDIDPTIADIDDPHPYLQSGFTHDQNKMPPGSPVDIKISEILGRKARESEYGWFAYRIGRGKLKPHSMYLLRIEYPEDQPRYCPIEIQTGQNYMDVGYKNGVGADDPYDNWPLSKAWQTFDVIVPLDDETVGTGGAGSASAQNGFWVYFMNKRKADSYYSMWSAGPAVGRIKLYEIDPVQNAPIIRKPQGLPQRVLSFDWERGADHEPADFVQYAKLMGYSAISPIVIKWAEANYSEPLNGYMTVNTDAQGYWAKAVYDTKSGKPAEAPVPGKPSEHVRYLEATKRLGLNYIPRFEWGGSQDLPKAAWAVGTDGQPIKPNRFAQWCANLLNPMTWDDLQTLMDHLVKPYAADNPQMTGVLWRIRCDRMPISYGADDLKLFSKETGTPLPAGGMAQAAAWASGEMRAKYDDWWHQKRADFHAKLVKLLQSYRSDLSLYYYNWDEDKFSLINPDLTSWAFVQNVVKPLPEGGRAAYEKERQQRKSYTAADYIEVLRTGNFGVVSKNINRADYGIRPSLYKDIKGIQIFAPANYLCYASLPEYLNYFQTADGLAVSNVVSYDEIGARSINPKYEGNMITPGGPAFSMALELLSYFNGDARTLNYTVYTYGRGFADAHRRFAQAFLALPAVPGNVVDQADADVKVRTYPTANGTYVGVAFKGYAPKPLTIKVPGGKPGAKVTNLVTGESADAKVVDGQTVIELQSGPVELNAYLIQ